MKNRKVGGAGWERVKNNNLVLSPTSIVTGVNSSPKNNLLLDLETKLARLQQRSGQR